AYHRFVQWQAHDQMRSVSQAMRRRGTHLYLDFPLGVHRHGYDVWRERESFALGASAGAPPDTFFPEGQDWGFPPFHPERIRREGYRSFIAALRHHLESASVLRLDHVMGLHRLFWIPQGATPRDGAYVEYRAEEFYAILALESQRRKALIIGEDLGTVPPTVRPAMRKHNIYRMFVLQYELRRDGKRALPPVPAHSLASLNTHDMSPFRAFWEALDVQDRLDLGLLDLKTAKKERASREALKKALVKFLRHSQRWESSKEATDTREVLRACLRHLFAGSRAPVMLNLEDLWLEPRPQNVPGTLDERPNWRRKARHSLEHIRKMPEIADLLRELNQLRS
ncbi:MAG: 4-alpha-glucanotransferase, partial [Acidobacteria bacterium]|nr:4-alpha-glucanotransferase [Acidobacteriota bacterium]